MWEDFLKTLIRQVEIDDRNSILCDRLDGLLLKFKIKLSQAQKIMLCQTIPAPSLGG
jgi:hypothetical protein